MIPSCEGDASPLPSAHRESSFAGSRLLSRLPFARSALETQNSNVIPDDSPIHGHNTASSSTIAMPSKTRRRRGSLRKVALLGRGAQRERRDGKPLAIDTAQAMAYGTLSSGSDSIAPMDNHDALGLNIAGLQSLPRPDKSFTTAALPATSRLTNADRDADGQASQDTSTTDEDDILHISHSIVAPRQTIAISSSGSDSYFATRGSSPRPGSFQQPKSPLSYSGISTNAIPTSETEWDYAETEWWGWVVLTVTWLVFVIGMGSCLDIWSWAWDVGRTPYAPPELEDDPTLPIVGYYPALIILTCVMAWVWVVVAWVGMKYFRHAKISGD